jgi:hypothetical protein
MSASPPKADVCGALADVCYGPIADIAPALLSSRCYPCVSQRTRSEMYYWGSSTADVVGFGDVETARVPACIGNGCRHAPVSIHSPDIVHPTCAKCGGPMWLTRIEPDEPGSEQRTFECKPAKTRRSTSSNADSSVLGYAIRPPSANESKCLRVMNWSNNTLSGISFTLAIGHMRAYICGIIDLTLGVSG